ncbi:nuclear transport factor 2 family protein [Rhodococcus sp. 06-462-5]|uniref:nuclear transport factor 2 family protein n=1 Tax=Nocardiaceae TaxID=85025 RepID=UPI00050C1F7E|nr:MULTISPECIES: nuclear transport factor 2 family protein [Rhodococcus]OZC74005.1 nuclear transport factor 2 family protein [Rhodococcus sp. 06-462-5]OZE68001.1 nuclear transport factor 2 family protein [Rhodococcus sp. 02-925g]OZF51977.1 nuclear transport factor 2 family protein [Rhodococcus sp. 14-1411-2a]
MTTTLDDRDELVACENARYVAAIAADTDAIRRAAHPALTYAHSDGRRDTLEEYLTKLSSGALNYHTIDHPISDVVITGDTAVVIGRMRAKLTVGGREKTIDNSCIAVWVRQDGRWVLLAYQPTPLAATGVNS